MTISQPLRAADVLKAIGVDTHIPYTDGGYADVAAVIADLAYLGLTQVRDGLSDGEYGSAPLASFVKLAQAGVQFTIVRGGGTTTTADLQTEIARLDRLNTAVPGSVVAVEGVNEIDNQPVTFNGLGGQAGAIALQQQLYAMVHADPALAGVTVDYFTGYNKAAGVDPDPSKTAGLADDDTSHPYPHFGEAPATWIDPQAVLENEGTSKGPFVYTETGYSTYGTDGSVVSENVQAKYTLDLLLDAVRDGASKTYLYQLMDAYAPGSRQGDDGFGLFGPGNVAKPAAVAIHNLTTILADAGATVAPATADYTLSGLPATGNSLAIAKSSGVVDVAVWAEPNIWNTTTRTEVAAPVVTATMALGATYASAAVYDPLRSASAVQVLHDVSSVQLALTDHPLIVELGTVKDRAGTLTLGGLTNGKATAGGVLTATLSDPDGTPASALYTFTDTTTHTTLATGSANSYTVGAGLAGDAIAVAAAYADAQGFHDVAQAATTVAVAPATARPGDTLVLNLSEDAWVGDAQFAVSVDGVKLGGPQTVTALHRAGRMQAFCFNGAFGPGTHRIAVSFLNDAFAGTAATDRNLYVGSVVLDGRTTAFGIAQKSQGTVTYTVQAPAGTAPVASPATQPGGGKLVLSLSEDAWKGDAQFTVSVDGIQVGGVQSVTALHAAGQSQDLALSGRFSAGAHRVAVDFLNDAYAGTAATDRNLYVKAITLDGTTKTLNAAQFSQGVATYTVTASASTDTTAGNQPVVADAGTTLILDDASAAAGTAVTFGGSGAVLQLTTAQSFAGTLRAFGTGDTLDLRSIGFSGSTTLGYAGGATAGTLSVGDGTHTARLAMLGGYGSGSFALASDGHGGTAVSFVGQG